MVLALIEIGRRGYEYSSQYIDKTKNKKKNIVFPNISDFDDFYTKLLEEFSIKKKPDSLLVLYSYIKNADVNGSLNIMWLGLEKQNVKLDILEEILRPENKRFMLNPVILCYT